MRESLLTFFDIDLWLAIGVQLHALEHRHEALGLCHALRLAHQPIAADGEPLQLTLEACDELVHAEKLDQPLVKVSLIHRYDALGVNG